MNTDKQEAKEAKERKRKRRKQTRWWKQRRGEPPHFLQVLISWDFKSNDFVTADSTGFAEAFFASAESKQLASAGVQETVTP